MTELARMLRQEEALKLTAKGSTPSEIAEALGVTTKTVHKDLAEVRRDYLEEHRGKAAKLIDHHLDIIEEGLQLMLVELRGTKNPKVFNAIIDGIREARHLYGYAPQQRELKVTHSRTVEQLADYQAELEARLKAWEEGAVPAEYKVMPAAQRPSILERFSFDVLEDQSKPPTL